MFLALVIGQTMTKHGVRFLREEGVAILLGVLAGALLKAIHDNE